MHAPTKILMVDDDSDDQLFFIDAINELAPSILCVIANNGLEAIDHLEKVSPPPALIFLDLNMPFMNGIECLAQLKSMTGFQTIPVIILSTSNHELDIERTLSMGAAHFLTKPADFEILKHKLKEILEGTLQVNL